MWRCAICLVCVFITLKELMTHIHLVHSSMPNFSITCSIDGCPRHYVKYHSFYKHVVLHHAEVYEYHQREFRQLPTNETSQETEDVDHVGANDLEVRQHDQVAEVEVDVGCEWEQFEYVDLRQQAGNFLTTLKESRGITESALLQVVNGTRMLLKSCIGKIQLNLSTKAEEEGEISAGTLRGWLKEVAEDIDPFTRLDSRYFLDLFHKSKKHYVEPRNIVLGESYKRVRKGNKFHIQSVPEEYYYIPLLDSLEQFLQNDRIFSMLSSDLLQAPDGFLIDWSDGEIFKNHPLFSNTNELVLPLILYYDEIEVCNPLGSHASVHKLCMFYYSFPTLPLVYRSRLPAIRLLAVANSHIVKQYGVDKILSEFVADMAKLQVGVTFQFGDEKRTVKAGLLAAIADTPASHELGGFKEGVGAAHSKCRNCLCVADDMRSKFLDHEFIERSRASYISSCREIERADTLYMQNHLKTIYGINRQSVMNEIPHFDVTKMLPQDIMHIILEGVAQYEIKEVLKYSKTTAGAEWSNFNDKLLNFPYGYFDIKDKPSIIADSTLSADDNRLKQKAGQMKVFLKILPFILIDFVDVDEPHFQFVIELLEIVHILFSPVLTLGTLSNLKYMIQKHLSNFKHLFPELPILPKQHYLIHAPMQMKKLGPLIRQSCIRFEAKHQYFKKLAPSQNFKNLPKSLATLHQKGENVSYAADDPNSHRLFANEKNVGPSFPLNQNRKPYILNKLEQFYQIPENEVRSVYTCKHVTLFGTKYVVGQSVLAVSASTVWPLFGLLKNIYSVNSVDFYFEFQIFETVKFEEKFQAYMVSEPALPEGFELRKPSDCLDYACYSVLDKGDVKYIPIEYDLTDMIDLYNEGCPYGGYSYNPDWLKSIY